MAQFGTVITNIGLAKITNAQITQETVGIKHMVLGDGNGAYYTLSQSQTSLKREVWRGLIADEQRDPSNLNRIAFTAYIPSTAGGFTIREVGLLDTEGNLIAVSLYPEQYKPQLAEGVSDDLLLHFVLETSNASVVTLAVDPTIIIASRKYVDDKVAGAIGNIGTDLTELEQRFATHSAEKASLTKLGHVKAETTQDGTLIIPKPDLSHIESENAELKREVANLKLYQEASQRIENGILFGDNFVENIPMGMTYNTALSTAERNTTFKGLMMSDHPYLDVLNNSIASQSYSNGTGSKGTQILGGARYIYTRVDREQTTTEFAWAFNEPIDLTDVTSIDITWRNDSGSTGNTFVWSYFVLSPTREASYTTAARTITKQNRFATVTDTIDTTNLTGPHYIRVHARSVLNSSYDNMLSAIYVNNIQVHSLGATRKLALYDLPETDQVVAYVEKTGDMDISAYVNNIPMQKEAYGNEFRFIGNTDTKGPVSLKLESVRGVKLDTDKIKKIVGGIAK